ncbi:MAG TPA: hypothetical protein VFT50_16325 [Baekduia sp.]|nr:hypothetical protein [Baekduia sp.]
MLSRVVLLLCVVALAAPAAASAQSSSPFAPLPPAQPSTPAPSAPVNAGAQDGGGLKGWQELLIVAAGGILLVGIGYAIVGDARRAAPVEEPTAELAASRAKREEDAHRRKQRARAASKRARAARKRNR